MDKLCVHVKTAETRGPFIFPPDPRGAYQPLDGEPFPSWPTCFSVINLISFQLGMRLRALPLSRKNTAKLIGWPLYKLAAYLNHGYIPGFELPAEVEHRLASIVIEQERALRESERLCITCNWRVVPEMKFLLHCEIRGLLWAGTVGCWRWEISKGRKRFKWAAGLSPSRCIWGGGR